MPLILPGNVGSATASTTYNVANSARFDDGSSDNLQRTYGTPTNAKIFALSWWIKLGKAWDGSGSQDFWGERAGSGDRVFMGINADGTFEYFEKDGGSTVLNIKTNRLFRDNSAWYHFLLLGDSTQGTASNRLKLYVNGVQETSFATESYPAEDYVFRLAINTVKYFGRIGLGGSLSTNYYDGYLCEAVFVDGNVTAHTDYGEFDSDSPTIWKPKDVSGLTFGNNGFYLDFEDSSALGNDVSGNDNDFTVNNLTAVDQSTDTCTNNFATLNPLYTNDGAITYSQGNLKAAAGSGSTSWTTRYAFSTIGVSAGRWYVEAKCVDSGGSNQFYFGVGKDINTWSFNSSLGYEDTGQGWGYYAANGNKVNNGTDLSTSGNSYTDGDIISMELDLEDMTLDFYKNGVKEGYQITSLPAGTYHFAINGYAAIDGEFNFGSPPYSESGGNSDGNGYGNFSMSVPANHYALNTKNLAEFG